MATVLLIDDSDAQRTHLRELLEAEDMACVLEARDGLEGLRRLVEEPVDLVICDVEMPGLDGAKLVHMSQAAQGRGVPFVMLTALQDPHRRARLFLDGAQDVITKPYHPVELVARIRHHLDRLQLERELHEKNALLERLSSTDDLTGLANRRQLEKALRFEFLRALRYGTPLCVVLADLDHFKEVNDRFGHAGGDRVLREVAEVFRSRLRATDTAGRYGGEEFLVVLGSSASGARVLADRWRRDLERRAIVLEDGSRIRVTMSLGVAERSEGMQDAEALVKAADRALYAAKAGGRNRVAMAEPGP